MHLELYSLVDKGSTLWNQCVPRKKNLWNQFMGARRCIASITREIWKNKSTETNIYSIHNTIIIREQGLTLQFYSFAKLGLLVIHLTTYHWAVGVVGIELFERLVRFFFGGGCLSSTNEMNFLRRRLRCRWSCIHGDCWSRLFMSQVLA